jgi:glutaredoxin 3
MAKVEIYTAMACPSCYRAVSLLSAKNIDFEKIDVTLSTAKRQAMRIRAYGRTSVPQIFINDDHIGGCDDLIRLDQTGHLDKLLLIGALD